MPVELNADFERLRQQFLEGLPTRARKLEQAWNRLHLQDWQEDGVTALQVYLQKLASAAAHYGYLELGANADYLAVYLQEIIDLHRLPSRNERQHIDHKIHQIKQSILILDTVPPIPNAIKTPIPLKQEQLTGQHIFIIDADQAHSSLVSKNLQKLGYKTQIFSNINHCMAEPIETPPHAILLDADQHPESIVAIISTLKTFFTQPVPILIMSARSDLNARLHALRAGSSDYLTKPFDIELLIEKLLRAIEKSTANYRVMVVDDDRDMAELEAEILRQAGMEVLSICNPMNSLEIASKFKPDLVILDMHMPDINGLELAILLRQDPEFLLLPIIFVTADTSVKLHQRIKALGVNALLVKPIDAQLLVKICQQTLASTVALKNRVARITQHSHQTQQVNTAYFFAAVDDEIHCHTLDGNRSALYYLSPSNYGNLQENLDKIELHELHHQFCEHLSEILGSDEHWIDISPLVACVLAGRHSIDYHYERANQLTKHLSEHNYRSATSTLALSFDFGICSLTPQLISAHQALLEAEQVFEQQTGHIPQNSEQQLPLATIDYTQIPVLEEKATSPNEDFGFDLSTLDIGRDLRLAYQPIITLEDAEIEHFTVLTRLQINDDQLVSASNFLNKLDPPGKRVELDRWALQKAVDTLTGDARAREQVSLFIHLAQETLQQKSFFSFVANVLRASRLRGESRLVFMLEEQWIADNPQNALSTMKMLKDLDLGICLTQAGSTSSTLNIMRSIPLDYLRLSPKLTGQAHNQEQLKSIVDLALTENIRAIATQIEDSRNLSALWMLGIRLFEGFFIQPPDGVFHRQNDIVFAQEIANQEHSPNKRPSM